MPSTTTTVRLPARELAAAWQNVSQACEKGAATIALEVYGPSAVRLVASDRTLFLVSWVGAGEPDPGRDEKPAESFVVSDDSGLAKGFFAHLLKVTKKDAEQWREVTISLKDVTLPGVPAFDGMAQRACIIDTDDHLVQLAVVEIPLPTWRASWPTPDRQAPVEHVAISPGYLERLGKFVETTSAVRLTFHTSKGPAVIHVDGAPPVSGFFTPAALSEDQVEVDELQALWDSSSGGGEA
jgi:hypothetical protein